MACVDTELCDKLDILHSDNESIITHLDSVSSAQATIQSSVDTGTLYIHDGFAFVLGFLAWFLFFIIIKFFLNIFNKMF